MEAAAAWTGSSVYFYQVKESSKWHRGGNNLQDCHSDSVLLARSQATVVSRTPPKKPPRTPREPNVLTHELMRGILDLTHSRYYA